MSSFTPLKTAFVSTIFAINALVNPAHSAPTEEIRDKPTCDLDFLVIDTLKDSSFLPTGIKGSMPFCVELDNLKDTDAPIHQPAAMLVAAD